MKTIIHILNTGSFSGAENVVITLIRQMKKQYENEYRLIYVCLRGSIEERLEEENIEYCLLEKLSIRNIQDVIKKYEPDIIHAHDYRASMLSSVVHGKIPLICHLHNNQSDLSCIGIKSLLYFLTTVQYQYILTVSEAINEEFVFGKWVKNKVKIVGNPINNQAILTKSMEGIGEFFDIVFLGRLSKAKNPVRFIKIMRQLADEYPSVQAAMIGTGELEAECKKYVQEWNLQDNICLLGFQENPYITLKNAKVLCVTSNWEGFGLMSVEALALGVPVVSTSVGGLKNIVTSDCGCICESDEEFVREVRQILGNSTYQSVLSNGALKRSKELENVEEYVSCINRLYKSM